MAPIVNGKLIFNDVPIGYPEPGKTTVYDTSDSIDLENVTLNKGSILIKVLLLSVDPHMRIMMRAPGAPGDAPPFELGKVIGNIGVGIIVRSENDDFKRGDRVFGPLNFAQYMIRENAPVGLMKYGFDILKNEEKLQWSAYIGPLGGPGRTAYYGWKEYARAKKGETVYVSTGAGATGSFVVQLAKRDGLKVIASAGSDEKVKFMQDLGADVAFNYKMTSIQEVLSKEGPIDIYWDNVGGRTLDAALGNAAPYSRFIECGMIAKYNSDNKDNNSYENLVNIISRRIQIFGLMSSDLNHKYGEEFMKEIPKLLKNGDIKYANDLTYGLDKAGDAIFNLLTGKNKGKAIVVVAEE